MVVHDVALQKLPVIFCLDRAGLVGDDGPTHHGCYDIAYMRCIPNMVVSAPMNERELRNLMYTAQLENNQLPIVIRYPRGEGVMAEMQKDTMAEKYPMEEIVIGKGRKLKDGKIFDDLSEENTKVRLEEARDFFNSSLAIYKATEKSIKEKKELLAKEKLKKI